MTVALVSDKSLYGLISVKTLCVVPFLAPKEDARTTSLKIILSPKRRSLSITYPLARRQIVPQSDQTMIFIVNLFKRGGKSTLFSDLLDVTSIIKEPCYTKL